MKPLLPILLVAILSGCAAIKPGEPTVASPDPMQLGLRDSAINWPADLWWQRYGDAQLNQLLVEALSGSPSLDAAQARLRLANAAVGSARAVRLPQANAGYQLTRERFSENYIYPPPFGGSMQTDTSLRLDVGLDLDLWGRNRARHAAAVSRQQAASADAQVARNALVSAVTQSYFSLQNALARQQVLSQLVSQLENVSDITRQRVAAGLDTTIEANQADSAVSATRVELSEAVTNADLLRNQIAALLGTGPQRGQAIQPTTLEPSFTGAPDSIPLALLGRRPDVVAARLRVEATVSDISAAKAEFYPNINLSAFAGFMSLGLSNLLDGNSQAYGIGPAISLPIFHGGSLNAQLDARDAERDLAIADYNQTLLTAVQEVADATTAIQALKQQTLDQAASLRAITSAYEIAVKRYKSGLGNYVQVLLAQNEVRRQAMLSTDMHTRAYKLDAQLATALGGGYDDRKTPQ